jgi:mRNA-degrading endonuclease toxin of MazEF toxin-antitoxin module
MMRMGRMIIFINTTITMSYKKWDVVFVSFPNQEDKSKSTNRPAIILDVIDDTYKICPITSKLHQKKHYPNSIIVSKNTFECTCMGLISDSLIVVDRVEIINSDRFLNKPFGTCPNTM